LQFIKEKLNTYREEEAAGACIVEVEHLEDMGGEIGDGFVLGF
jgi:hypothetical protein